jgi:tight adherence protein B
MVFIGVFTAVTLGLLIVFLVPLRFLRQDHARIRKRMAEEFGTDRADGEANSLYGDLDSLSASACPEGAASSAEPERSGQRLGAARFRKRLDSVLQQANFPLRVEYFLLLATALGMGTAALGMWVGGWQVGLAAFLVGACAPFLLLNVRRQARREKFLQQLPNAFELMARVLRAGQSVPQSFQAIADAFEDPLASEFAGCLHQQNLGLRPEVTFREMARRSGIVELRIFVMAMMIQRKTGGNLSEMLDRLGAMVRARLRLRQQIRTLTAEGRLQGLTLVVLPVLVFVAMLFLNRRYAQVLLDHGSLLLATAGCMTIGMLWIRRIVRFEG